MNGPAQRQGTTPLEWVVRPFQEFAQLEASGGILLIGCTIAALLWANSRWAESYFHFWHINLTLGWGAASLSGSLHFWINDALMALFFLLVGLEIKRELLVGELASFQRAALPIAAAIGGMLIPSGLYFLFNGKGAAAAGWGIPMATDIAFALGVLALLGSRAPVALKVFLAALAIADDIGAVLVIACFYTAAISWISLGIAALFVVILLMVNRAGIRHPLVYVLLGIGLWIAVLKSGVHATVAGVLLAMTIPSRERSPEQESLMLRFEHTLTPWIKNVIMPVFALSSAGVALGPDIGRELVSPIGLGIMCGLGLGKPVGIVGFAWLATRAGMAALPEKVSWPQIIGVGFLGGIGFTMSLFIADLAFGLSPVLDKAKTAILGVSVLAGLAGAIILARSRNRNA